MKSIGPMTAWWRDPTFSKAAESIDGAEDERRTRVSKERSQVTYVVRAGAAVKIGVTGDLPTRMAQLQTGMPHSLILLGVFPEGREREQQLHYMFRKDRIRGEWFRATIIPELLGLLSEEGVSGKRVSELGMLKQYGHQGNVQLSVAV